MDKAGASMIGPNQSMTAKRLPWSFHCEKPKCYWRTGHETREDAERIKESHRCPLAKPARKGTPLMPKPVDNTDKPEVSVQRSPEGTPKFGRDGKSINELIWDKLDEVVDEIRAFNHEGWEATVVLASMKGYANGMADALALWAPPIYASRELVLKQAMRRHKMRLGELPFSPTFGYNHGWRPDPSENFTAQTPVNTALDRANKSRKKATSKTASTKQIPAEAIEGVKAAIKAGWELKQIAGLYKVSVDEVQRVAQG